MRESHDNLECRSHFLDLIDRLKRELKTNLESYHNESAALTSFEKYSKLSRKTLRNFLSSKNSPYPATIVGFYKWIYKENDESKLIDKLDLETKQYLIGHGYDISAEKRDISNIIFQSSIHYELYLITEDQQVIKKSNIERTYGTKGLDALNDLLLEEIITAVDESTFTTGKIRSIEDVFYCQNATLLLAKSLPWSEARKNNLDQDISYRLGNFIASKNDRNLVNKAFYDLNQKLVEIHQRGLKENLENQEKFVYSTLVYKPLSERT